MAGGVWWLEECQDSIDNPELGPVGFGSGTPAAADQGEPDRRPGRAAADVAGGRRLPRIRFQPTGFYSSAVNNGFIRELRERNERQVAFTSEVVGEHVAEYGVGPRKRLVFLTPGDLERARGWEQQGFTEALRTPDSTLIFVTPEQARRSSPIRSHAWAA